MYAALAATRARFVSRHLNWKLDPWLLRVTGGRFATTLVFPTALLETTGARTGSARSNAIIYFHDGPRVTIVASNAGAPRHPAWYYNVRAHPEVTFGGIPMRATVIEDGAEITRLHALSDRVFPAFAKYREEAATLAARSRSCNSPNATDESETAVMLRQAIGEFLPAAIAVALSPIPIIGVVLVLDSERARRNGPASRWGGLRG